MQRFGWSWQWWLWWWLELAVVAVVGEDDRSCRFPVSSDGSSGGVIMKWQWRWLSVLCEGEEEKG
ncbi:hypothetical protein HanXRQr2_Chr14g0645561 [Helianthus annuus]|uniref:Secreted protein n=1 Tax=Helianthus annuus TaxID=4232 RepID=A0A9K3EAV8_HELAN|nr:hypothetical protein HanXRQr2_Chr14g0645561 [Helianthus annuus]KAJ0840492.1 hypothetical protein HanPSC8_Chr14g0619441 [Helianthus annuus]